MAEDVSGAKEKGAEKKEVSREEKLKLIEKAKKRRETFLRLKMAAAKRFAALARAKLGNMIKAIAVFGSYARGDFSPGSDVDILVLIDDTQKEVPEELREKLHLMLQDMAKKVDKSLHIQLHTLTEFWNFVRDGDVIIYNFLKHIKPIYDAGVIKPLARLLRAGEIKPSREAIFKGIDGAEFYYKKATEYFEWILERLYRTVTWAGNALVMSVEAKPVTVPELPFALQKYVDEGVISEDVPLIVAEVIKEFKQVEHKEKKVDPKKVLELYLKTQKVLEELKREVAGGLAEEGQVTSIKYRVKTMPKIIFEFKDNSRVFVWLLDKGIYAAYYEDGKLKKVLKSSVKEGKVLPFKASTSEELFEAMGTNQLRPLINQKLIRMIFDALPVALKKEVKQVAVEYPGRAMLDLTGLIHLRARP